VDEWLTRTQAAERAGVNPVTIWRKAKSGELESAALGGHRFYLASDVDEFREVRMSTYHQARQRREAAAHAKAHAPRDVSR
jgi:hypothetical protein